jgi:type IV pilus assembly protein PilW
MQHTNRHNLRRRSRGFTLVELMIAILIGLFIAAGLVTLVQAMKRTSTSQNGLSQLQDNERMGMSLIANAVQSAGYYPNPLLNTATTFFTVSTTAPVFAAGQSMTGSVNTSSALRGDQITLRYTTAGADNVLNCAGATTATQTTWTATFSIDANQNLQCVLFDGTTTTTVPLVAGVTKLQVLYGVQTNGSALFNSADTYLAAAAVNAGNYWGAIRSVVVTLTFNNPLAGQPGQSTVGTTIPFTRIITAMNTTGVDT